MEYFSDPEIHKTKQPFYSIVASACIHSALIILTMSLPFFVTRSYEPVDFVNVMLLESIGPDITSEPSTHQPETTAAPKNEPPKKIQRQELVDPSETEIERMRRRKATPTPEPQASESDNFDIQSGLLPDGGGQTRGSLQVDVRDFPFHYYLSMLRTRVSENWIPPFGIFDEEHKRVVVAFRIDRQGNQHAVRVEESSGDPLLDQSALRAVVVSSPFPPLPDGFSGASLGVFFGFSVHL
jgi:TonB family protein